MFIIMCVCVCVCLRERAIAFWKMVETKLHTTRWFLKKKYLLTAIGLSPDGSGYFTYTQV